MNRDDVRRWVENHRRAAERERSEARRHRLDAAEAISAAMALLRYHEALHGSPFDSQDAVTRREDEQMWEAWSKLRRRWRDER